MSKNTGGPYFPQTSDSWHGDIPRGASLRDRLAIAALPAVIEVVQRIGDHGGRTLIATLAWELADAVLERRDRISTKIHAKLKEPI